MSSIELLDELEAGELSIQFEGEEPEALLEWAIAEFMPGIAISTSFQIDSVVLIDMAYEIDPDSAGVQRRHGPPAGRDARAGRPPARPLPGPAARARRARRRRDREHGRQARRGSASRRSVDLRLLCCNLRKVRPLTKHLHSLDAWVTGLRRDQWASRTNIRKVEIDHDHGAIVKLNPLAEWTEEEVWDYVRERDVPVPLALRPRLHLDRLRAVHARDRARRGEPRPAAGGGRRTRRRSAASTARSRAAGSSTSCTRSSARRHD